MEDTAGTPDTETFTASDSTPSTLPLRLSDSLSHSDVRPSLRNHLNEAKDSISSGFQSLLDVFIQRVEEAFFNDISVVNSRGPSATVSEPDLSVTQRPATSISDKSTQTPRNVVVSARFLERNELEKALMRAEIVRLNRDLKRARLERDYARYEVSSSQRDRLSELRRVWEAEKAAVVDGVVEICEQDAQKKIQEVKKKQWCTYCGNEAFFYCCWNTVYCNVECQQLHWPEHMNSCTHPKKQVISQAQAQRQMH